MAKGENKYIKNIKLVMPTSMEYYISTATDKDKDKLINRIEKIVRSSMEYRDYIAFIKEHIGLDKCIFFQNVSNIGVNKYNKVSIELHHEPLTLYDIVSIVLTKYIDEGITINDLFIADEVLNLHYSNKVGLVPLSKTAHEIIHAKESNKLFIPLNMVYGEYSQFLDEYANYIPDEIYYKIEKKIEQTEKVTPETFDAITKEFKYLDIKDVDDISKMEVNTNKGLDFKDPNSSSYLLSQQNKIKDIAS